LSGAKLGGRWTLGANLSGANLSDAKLHGADLSRADLRGALVADNPSRPSDPSRTTTILQRQLDQACGTNVKLDPGLTLKPCPLP
jgi:uncharacterized protein YjbI with pentapeptide repeats